MKTIKSLLSMICIALALTTALQANPLKRFNFSVWSDYTGMNLNDLSQEEKTAKLQKLFEDKVNFAKSYNTRRILVRILNPGEFDFFNTENYDATRDDNFYYWAMKLSQYAEIEAVFDTGPFNIGSYSWTDRFINFAADFLKAERPLGVFRDMIEKLSWVSFMNEMENPNGQKRFLIQGITIDPKNAEDQHIQLVINMLDQYRYGTSKNLPSNPYQGIRLGMYLGLDQKAMALCNLGRFPLRTDIRGQQPKDIGVNPPENFPSNGPEFTAPSWRENNNQSMLDTVYLKMADKRLVEAVYQNRELLPNPAEDNPDGVKTLSTNLTQSMRAIPFVKGPGKITIQKGSADIKGKYTFFRTGGGKFMQGQVFEGGCIEVGPPYLSQPVRKVIAETPSSNKVAKLSSAFSTTEDLNDVEYQVSPTPTFWSYPKLSNHVCTKIYYVFSTDFKADEGRFFGNWNLDNFLNFIHVPNKNPRLQSGFLTGVVYRDLKGSWITPSNNIVLHDFTTIPNGTPYPECDWQLGNHTHY